MYKGTNFLSGACIHELVLYFSDGSDDESVDVMTKQDPFKFPQTPKLKSSSSPASLLASDVSTGVDSCLAILQRLQESTEEEESASTAAILDCALAEVAACKKRVLSGISSWIPQVPNHLLHSVPAAAGTTTTSELPLLFGRCFNLSMNLKILKSATSLDPLLAGRILGDLCVLERGFEAKKKGVISSCDDVSSLGISGLELGGRRRPRLRLDRQRTHDSFCT